MYRGRIKFSAAMWWFMAFVFTFTLGGVTGVLMSIPALDFQVHNTMFLVAHFHNVIIGGVLFGFFAGINYWWPKVFGFRLHDGLGKLSAVLWQIGFLLAFMPLYALGLMGAVRRIDHYTDPTWQPFFIVSAAGVLLIGAGIAAMVAQFAYSIWKRKKLRDSTGDPWDGRTLEWSVPSPAPEYNFVAIPQVTHRDEWWYRKQRKLPMEISSEPIAVPKNSSMGLIIAVLGGLFCFGVIWHLVWLVGLAFVAIIVAVIWRTTGDDNEKLIRPGKRAT